MPKDPFQDRNGDLTDKQRRYINSGGLNKSQKAHLETVAKNAALTPKLKKQAGISGQEKKFTGKL